MTLQATTTAEAQTGAATTAAANANTGAQTTAATQTTGATATTDTTPGPIPYERFKELNDKYKQLEQWKAEQDKAAAKVKQDADAAEAQRLVEQNEFKTLAGKYEARVKELEPLAERVKALETTIQGFYDAQVATLGAKAQAALAAMPGTTDQKLAWLAANQHLFTSKAAPPNLNQNDQGAITGGLTMADVKKMSRDEINARWAEVSKLLDTRTASP